MSAREELAEVLLSARWPDGDTSGFPTKRVAEMLADALLASPALADLIREKQAEALQGVVDELHESGAYSEHRMADWVQTRADRYRADRSRAVRDV